MRDKNKEIIVKAHLDPVFQVHYRGKEVFMTKIMEINKLLFQEILVAKVH